MKISEIITGSGGQIINEASVVLQDLPGTPIDFKILNPENVGKKKIDPRVPKYLYFDFRNGKWYERKQTGLGRLAQKYLNPFADNTYMVEPERSPEDTTGGSAAEEPPWMRSQQTAPGLGRKLDTTIPADKVLIDALVHKYGEDPYAAANKDTTLYGSDNNRYEYDQDSNLWVDEETQKTAPRKMQIELFARYGRDRRGYPLNNAVDPRDTKEKREQKFRNKLKEFSRQELVIWRKYSDKIKSYADLEERAKQYKSALNTIALKRQDNINIAPLAKMFDPAYLGLEDDTSKKDYKTVFKRQLTAGGAFQGLNSKPTPPTVRLTMDQMTQAAQRIVAIFTAASKIKTETKTDAQITDLAEQIEGYSNDLYLLANNKLQDQQKITRLGVVFVKKTQDLAKMIDATGADMSPNSLGLITALSRTALAVRQFDSGTYNQILTTIFVPLLNKISNTPSFKTTYPDALKKITDAHNYYKNPKIVAPTRAAPPRAEPAPAPAPAPATPASDIWGTPA